MRVYKQEKIIINAYARKKLPKVGVGAMIQNKKGEVLLGLRL